MLYIFPFHLLLYNMKQLLGSGGSSSSDSSSSSYGPDDGVDDGPDDEDNDAEAATPAVVPNNSITPSDGPYNGLTLLELRTFTGTPVIPELFRARRCSLRFPGVTRANKAKRWPELPANRRHEMPPHYGGLSFMPNKGRDRTLSFYSQQRVVWTHHHVKTAETGKVDQVIDDLTTSQPQH